MIWLFEFSDAPIWTPTLIFDDLDAWLAQAGAANLPSGNPYLIGDANLDGDVDGLDFIAWNGNKFQTVNIWTGGDFNADGVVDGLDYILWNGNKFQSALIVADEHSSDLFASEIVDVTMSIEAPQTVQATTNIATWKRSDIAKPIRRNHHIVEDGVRDFSDVTQAIEKR